MVVLLAVLSLVLIGIALMVGNLWFSYGLWPTSWSALAVFIVLQVIWQAIAERIRREFENF